MDTFLAKLTQQAMNYAIRSGIAITSGYAVRQCSRLLKTIDNREEYDELQSLQDRLHTKIKIVSPAIDIIELISARGNTSLESAVALTTSLRCNIQNLGQRMDRAAAADELARQGRSNKSHQAAHKDEIRQIIVDIKRLLTRIDDAVPLINLAITTSGSKMSTVLPVTVSPSRLLQASTCLTACDTRYAIDPTQPVQVGPTFTLSLYMLFAGHSRPHDERALRDTTWKEAMHKAKVKLMRVPAAKAEKQAGYGESVLESVEADPPINFVAENPANEFAYQLVIIEDLDDHRVHTFEDGEPQPGSFEDVELAGMREHFPIHQVSKIFYADTGKILSIGETNSPILLLKRDVNAMPPRRMIHSAEREEQWLGQYSGYEEDNPLAEDQRDTLSDDDKTTSLCNSQDDIDEQLRRENSALPMSTENPYHSQSAPAATDQDLRLPANLDPEWVAFEVYQDPNDEDDDESLSDSEDDVTSNHDSTYTSAQASNQLTPFVDDFKQLGLSTPSVRSTSERRPRVRPAPPPPTNYMFGPVRSSLSLLEMLIRLTALQQYQQASHLSIPDELLTFFLEENSTTGGAGDEERKKKRTEARTKLGFDPYHESPIKHHGEEYQINGGQTLSPEGSAGRRSVRGSRALDDWEDSASLRGSRSGWNRSRSGTPVSPRVNIGREQWLLRDAHNAARSKSRYLDVNSPASAASPISSRLPRPLDGRSRQGKAGMPFVSPDSTLGTSSGNTGTSGMRSGVNPGNQSEGRLDEETRRRRRTEDETSREKMRKDAN